VHMLWYVLIIDPLAMIETIRASSPCVIKKAARATNLDHSAESRWHGFCDRQRIHRWSGEFLQAQPDCHLFLTSRSSYTESQYGLEWQHTPIWATALPRVYSRSCSTCRSRRDRCAAQVAAGRLSPF
jgi:hypothetical protein